jgi:hypothetical protein
MRTLRLVIPAAALLIAACAHASSSPLAPEWPWPRVTGSDGRSALQLQTIQRTGPWTLGGDDTWQIQGQIEHDDPDVLLSDLHATIRVTTDDGSERLFGREKTTLDAAHRSVVLQGLELGPDPKRIASLDVELRLVRPKTWATATESLEGLGAERNVVLAPFEFGLSATENAITVTAYSTNASLAAGPPRDAVGLLSHRWAAAAATIRDAKGAALDAAGGGGSGGFTRDTYLRMSEPGGAIEFPLTVTVRVPDAVDVEVVRYRFTDLDLASVPRVR